MSVGADFALVEPWLTILLVGVAYPGLLAAAELFKHRAGLSGETTRKLVHAGGGIIALAFPSVISAPWQAVVIAIVFSAFFAATRWSGRLRSIHDVRRPSIGAELYPVGIAVAFLLARGDWAHYSVAVLALAIGDAAAAFVGGRWGRHRFCVWGAVRSLEGSAAACAATLVVAVPVLLLAGERGLTAVLTAASVAIAVAFVEAGSPWGTDNLTIPVAAILILALQPADAAAIAAMGLLFVLSLGLRGTARPAATASVTR